MGIPTSRIDQSRQLDRALVRKRRNYTRQKDWQLTTNCKVCKPQVNKEMEYPLSWDIPFPNTLIGIESFIEDFGDNYVPGFRNFKSYRGPFIPFMCGTSNHVQLEP